MGHFDGSSSNLNRVDAVSQTLTKEGIERLRPWVLPFSGPLIWLKVEESSTFVQNETKCKHAFNQRKESIPVSERYRKELPSNQLLQKWIPFLYFKSVVMLSYRKKIKKNKINNPLNRLVLYKADCWSSWRAPNHSHSKLTTLRTKCQQCWVGGGKRSPCASYIGFYSPFRKAVIAAFSPPSSSRKKAFMHGNGKKEVSRGGGYSSELIESGSTLPVKLQADKRTHKNLARSKVSNSIVMWWLVNVEERSIEVRITSQALGCRLLLLEFRPRVDVGTRAICRRILLTGQCWSTSDIVICCNHIARI